MSATPLTSRLAALALLLAAGTTARAQSAPPVTTLLVRLGADTLAVEQYTRTSSRMDGVLVSRSPFTTLSHYTITLGANSAPVAAEYSLRKGDGTIIQGAMQSLTMHFLADSVHMIGHRAAGDTARFNAAHGELVPYVNGSYGLFEIPLARLLATNRDSAQFALVPLAFAVRNTNPLPMTRYARDSVRISWFGYPVYARHDGSGHLLGIDGRESTIKVRVERVANVDMDSLGKSWSARELTDGTLGPTSTRDTVRATIGGAKLWIDYGRPALRGRDVWVHGVLGDSIWRTGANAATQLHTDGDLLIGGQVVPAGTYTLWTQVTPDGYHLIVNKQFGQWGTEYDASRDLIRVPLRDTVSPASAERFTIGVDPHGASDGAITLAWGTKLLTVPVATR
jgi:hypothetical protein